MRTVRVMAAHSAPLAVSESEAEAPFSWVKTADQILAKAVRKTQADSGTGH